LADIQLFENVESEGAKKMKTMRKWSLMLSIYVCNCAASLNKINVFIYLW